MAGAPTSISRPRGCSTTSRARRGRRGWSCSSRLSGEGVTLAELRDAVGAGHLALLPVERAIAGDGPRYSAREIAERSGLDLELALAFRAALGIPYGDDPDERVGTEADLDAARRTKAILDAGFPVEEMLRNARTVGMATARVAEANRELVVRNLTSPGDTERDIADRLVGDRRFPAAAGQRVPRLRLPGQPARAGQTRRDRRRRPRGGGDRRGGRADGLLRRPGRVHQPRRGDRAGGAGRGRGPPRGAGDRRRRRRRCGW